MSRNSCARSTSSSPGGAVAGASAAPLVLSACGRSRSRPAPDGVAADTIELKVSHYLPPSHGIHRDFIEPWARRLEARTDGRVKVTVHPGNTSFGDITNQLDTDRFD